MAAPHPTPVPAFRSRCSEDRGVPAPLGDFVAALGPCFSPARSLCFPWLSFQGILARSWTLRALGIYALGMTLVAFLSLFDFPGSSGIGRPLRTAYLRIARWKFRRRRCNARNSLIIGGPGRKTVKDSGTHCREAIVARLGESVVPRHPLSSA